MENDREPMDSLTNGTTSLLRYDDHRRQLDLLCVIRVQSSVMHININYRLYGKCTYYHAGLYWHRPMLNLRLHHHYAYHYQSWRHQMTICCFLPQKHHLTHSHLEMRPRVLVLDKPQQINSMKTRNLLTLARLPG